MPRKTHNHRLDIPPLELECMKQLWTLGSATVHQVRAELLPTRPLAYTTVMTLMDRLARKGLAEREKRGRAYLYRPVLAEQSARDFALDRLTRNFFRGSRDSLREYLAGNGGGEPSAMPPSSTDAAAEPTATAPRRAKPAPRARPSPAEDTIDPSLL
ncbi:MAG TPA: BlaI/MecI/CopY family transcriptional regulator [Terriglobia bacterium]|nr:BlaI/MecI/CopY family transcriptional regulator [Terriglobia bacterium]